MASLGSGLDAIRLRSQAELHALECMPCSPLSTDSEDMHYESPTDNTTSRSKSYDEELEDWFNSGNKFMRHEDLFHSIIDAARKGAASNSRSTIDPTTPTGPRLSRTVLSASRFGAIGTPPRPRPTDNSNPLNPASPKFNVDTTRVLIPVLENLAAYVQGPPDQRRDYWCRWSEAPEWCVDRSPGGNSSFNDENWGRPPQRLGRDSRYRPYPGEGRMGGGSRMSSGGSIGGLDRRFMIVGARY